MTVKTLKKRFIYIVKIISLVAAAQSLIIGIIRLIILK